MSIDINDKIFEYTKELQLPAIRRSFKGEIKRAKEGNSTYEEFLSLYENQNANAILSGWAVPVQWIKEPKKAKDCKYKVSFVGAAHGDRKDKIKYLKNRGIEVKCFGYGWENGAIKANEIPKIFNDSIISLNFANSSGENQIKARVFEVSGSGGFLLTENAKN